jgi:predicted acyltransferase (DUF342 family)
MYGTALTTAASNIIIGENTAVALSTGADNVVIGTTAGAKITTGVSNVILGNVAGPTGNVSNELYIHNAESDTPLIWGDFSAGEVVVNGDFEVTGTVVMMGSLPTSDPSNAGQLWRSGSSILVST